MNWLRRQHGQAQRVLQGLVLGIILLIAAAPGAQAQEARGSITGRVIDTSGAVLPGVTITIVNVQTNSTSTAITNESGQYTVVYLNPAVYTVGAELARVQEKAAGKGGSARRRSHRDRLHAGTWRDHRGSPGVGRKPVARNRQGHDGSGDRQQAHSGDSAG